MALLPHHHETERSCGRSPCCSPPGCQVTLCKSCTCCATCICCNIRDAFNNTAFRCGNTRCCLVALLGISVIFTASLVSLGLGYGLYYGLCYHFPTQEAATLVAKEKLAADYLAASCNTLTGRGCVPWQLPMYSGAAGQSWVPVTKYLAPDALQKAGIIQILDFEEIDEETTSYVEQYATDVMKQSAHSFALSADVGIPLEELGTFAFGMSFSHKELVRRMYSSEAMYGYARAWRRYKVFTASIANIPPGGFPLSTTFKSAVAELPDNPFSYHTTTPTAEQLQWVCFFDTWGTHYTKVIDFGGIMSMRSIVNSDAWSNSKYSESSFKEGFSATFEDEIKLGYKASFGQSTASASKQAYSRLQKETETFAVGGHECERNFKAWLPTVKMHPAPISTQLGLLSDLISPHFPSKNVKAAFQFYLKVCPHTDKGICNGLGSCNYCDSGEGVCTCSGDGVYKEDDGLCYPKCEDNCNYPQGHCKYGKCICNKVMGFGWTGSTCTKPCGYHKYTPGTQKGNNGHTMGSCGATLVVPGTDLTYTVDKEDDMDEFCRAQARVEGLGSTLTKNDNDLGLMRHINFESMKCKFAKQSTYLAAWPHFKACHMHAFHDCSASVTITCQFGGDGSCDGHSTATTIQPSSLLSVGLWILIWNF